MKVIKTRIYVDDLDKALEFYTGKIGFIKKGDEDYGGCHWLSVISAEDEAGVELILEENTNPVARKFQKDLRDQDFPAAMLGTANLKEEYERLSKVGVNFVKEPTYVGTATIALFDDTVGNLIEISQEER